MMKHTQQRGFNLVELMVALTLALVAILAATQLYASTRQSYRLQNIQSHLADDGRFALAMLRRVLPQAGFQPDITKTRDSVFVKTTGTDNKEFLTPNSSSSVTLRFISDGSNMVGCDGAVIASTTDIQSLTISKSDEGELNCVAQSGTISWVAPSGKGSELLDFQLNYGTDTGPTTLAAYGCGADEAGQAGKKVRDCVADQYTWEKATSNPDKIVAIQACLVLRSEETDPSVDRGSNYKNCSDTEIANSAGDHRIYRTFRSTILLRN